MLYLGYFIKSETEGIIRIFIGQKEKNGIPFVSLTYNDKDNDETILNLNFFFPFI